MSDETNAPGAGSEAAPVVAPANLESDSVSVEQAYDNYLKKSEPAESAKTATAETELAKADAAPETDPGETTTDEAEPEAEALPPIERPRSWAKDLDEEWASYPREAQEKIAKREQERDAATRRSQNEAADIRKAAEAERTQAEQARKDYEAKLPGLMQALQDAQAGTFSDVRTMDDVTRLAAEDPFRYLQWQAHQQKLQAVNYELEKKNERTQTEQQNNWQKLVSDENAKFIERVPEFADKTKAQELTTKAVERLSDLGFTQNELADLANGKERLPIYDHRIQQLLVDSLKLAEIQKAPLKAIPKPVPAVQRPGVSAPKSNSDAVQANRNKLNSSGSVEDAYALYQAKQKARA